MRVFLLLLALVLPCPALAQGPSANWRTLETPHFRVHYPAESEAWARRAAARLESIRERVVAEVGYEPPETVDVLISDPAADPNGMALPILGWPRMVLWTSPPGPDSVIGHYTDWGEIVTVHEEAHLVHLLRPSRNPLRRTLATILPVSPLALGAPRWVYEGYATVVEGRLTASGRPHGDMRATILRRWAQAGKLPSYGRLASDSSSWLGDSMAYLVGSAYLEWLEERTGPGSLRNLWSRMTARRVRSFEEAFEGVFGDSPADLYDRFRAETTWRAVEAERQIGQTAEGAVWQDLSWTVGDPAVSPDGERLAIVLGHRERPSRLVVWSTEPDEEAEKEWEEQRQRILAEDPEDVPAVRTRPLPRKALHTLEGGDGPAPATPRWMPDGESILFVRYEPDAEGFLFPDLFVWTPESGEVRRITREAGVRQPDPAPDGTWAVAVRQRHGFSQLVRVDLGTGEVREITPPTVEEVYDRPRLSPDGRRIAFAHHREGLWRLTIRDLESGEETTLAPPADGTVATPAWSPDGRTVYAVVGNRGFIDLWRFPAGAAAADAAGTPAPLTRGGGGALAPAPTPDGRGVFYLAMDPDGLDLRRLELAEAAALAPVELPAELAPVVRPAAPEAPEPFATADLPQGRLYGFGRQELLPLFGGSGSSAGGAVELGVRGGDVVGRLDWLVLGSLSGTGWTQGGAVAAAWRGWPVEVGFHLFQASETPSDQNGPLTRGLGRRLDLDRWGAELSAGWNRQWSGGSLRLDGRALQGRVDAAGLGGLGQDIASLAGSWAGYRRRGLWRGGLRAGGRYEVGRTGDDSWSRYGAGLLLSLGHDEDRLRLSWQRNGSADVTRDFDRFQLGGSASSLLPESVLANRIEVPALPAGVWLGDEHESQRAELELGFLPVPLFFERHRLWSRGENAGDWLSLAGLELTFAVDPIPLGRVPAFDLRAGVARVLDDPLGVFEDETRWWLVTVWRP